MKNDLPNNSLIANSFFNDPRIAEAKNLILNTLKEHQKEIKTIRPPNKNLQVKYDELLNLFAEYRGSKLWHPYLGSGIGNGALVELLDGSVKYDFISGIGVHYWGHSHNDIISASLDAAISDTVMQGNLQQNQDSVDLSELLIKTAGMDHCFLTTSGAMANENALKIAFQKRFPAQRVLAFDHCFAGRTTTMAQITDKPSFREGLPETIRVDYIPFFDPSRPQESTQHTLKVLNEHLKRYPRAHALMLLELVQGENGFYVGDKDFFRQIMQVLKKHEITILVDEVQTFARTSELFAFQHFELQEFVDIVTIGKVAQVGATLFKASYRPKPGLLSQTFTSSTAAIHTAKVIIEGLLNGDYLGQNGKINQLFDYFSDKLQQLHKRYPQKINGPYGIGTMIAFTPFDGDTQRVTEFAHTLFQKGVISFIAGSNPTRIRFLLPAGAITNHDIDAVTKIIEDLLAGGANE